MDWFLYDNGLCHERVKFIGAVAARSWLGPIEYNNSNYNKPQKLYIVIIFRKDLCQRWKVATPPGCILELFWTRTSKGRFIRTLSCICLHIIIARRRKGCLYSLIYCCEYKSFIKNICFSKLLLIITSKLLFCWSLRQDYCYEK